MTNYEIHKAVDTAAVGIQLTSYLRQCLSASSDDKFFIGVSGGSMVGLLTGVLKGLEPGEVSRLRLFLVDERLVPQSDKESTQGAFVSAGCLASFIPPVQDELSPEDAASAYEKSLRGELGGKPMHLLLLGMGPDGHTASLFPDHSVFTRSLNKEDAGKLYVGVRDSPKPPPNRITLTLGAMAAASNVAFVTTGAAKAPVLKDMVEKKSKLPIGAVTSATGIVHVFADAPALP